MAGAPLAAGTSGRSIALVGIVTAPTRSTPAAATQPAEGGRRLERRRPNHALQLGGGQALGEHRVRILSVVLDPLRHALDHLGIGAGRGVQLLGHERVELGIIGGRRHRVELHEHARDVLGHLLFTLLRLVRRVLQQIALALERLVLLLRRRLRDLEPLLGLRLVLLVCGGSRRSSSPSSRALRGRSARSSHRPTGAACWDRAPSRCPTPAATPATDHRDYGKD